MKTVDPLHGVAAFLAVAEHESFTAGAAALGLTRATVSAQVSELEARLGVRLLHRSTRSVRLTPAGQAYRARLADLPGRMAEAERAARAEQTAPEGRLRVTAPPDLAMRFLVPWVSEFLAAHP
ncbi:MAG: LysR family transcriptional regulator, partial [Paracoccaceae bacterium]|nr:LysR family transcriptional regulator [Paracoccaceae bacterium]